MDKTITQQLEDIKEQMCDKYCRFPELSRNTASDADEAFEWLMHNCCDKCPMNEF